MKNKALTSSFIQLIASLIAPMIRLWLVVWLLAVVVMASGLGLSVLSAWFLSKALLGLLVIPPVLLGVLALVRVVGRYGELLVSHAAIFGQLTNLRVLLFEQFIRYGTTKNRTANAITDKDPSTSSIAQHRLIKHIDVLNEFVLRFITPVIVMISAVGVVLVVLFYFGQWLAMAFVLLSLGFSVWAVAFGNKDAPQESLLQQNRSTALQNVMPALTHLVIWGQWANMTKRIIASANEFDQHHANSQAVSFLAVLMVQWALSFAVLSVVITAYHHNMPTALVVCVFVLFALYEFVLAIAAQPMALGRSLAAKTYIDQSINKTAIQKTTCLPDEYTVIARGLTVGHTNCIMPVLIDDFCIQKGVPLVITGVSGAGKSTLLQTIAGEIEPVAGEIWVHDGLGQAIAMAAIDKQAIGFLGQKVDIFDQSLAINLSLGQDIDDDQLMMALQKVGLDDWAKNLPNGLQTPLGEYGQAVSGGQARRIALARFLLSPKKILLLDEPFAGLDYHTRQQLWRTLKRHQQDGMLVVVSHHNDLALADCQVVAVG